MSWRCFICTKAFLPVQLRVNYNNFVTLAFVATQTKCPSSMALSTQLWQQRLHNVDIVFNQAYTKYAAKLLCWKQIFMHLKVNQPPHSLPVRAKADVVPHLLLPCNFRSQYQSFGGSSVSLPTGDGSSSQGDPHLTLTQPSPPRRKHRQLTLSAPQFQPDLQIALWLTSNSHTVY